MPKPILTVALYDNKSVHVDLADGVSLSNNETEHGFARMLAAIYRNIYAVPKAAGLSPAQCRQSVARILDLSERYVKGQCKVEASIGITTPKPAGLEKP